MVNWLGSPLGKKKNVNFFKTNSKDIPVNMFKDNDRDGVANVFDCKPNNPNKQGLIDAVIGAVKGVGKGGVRQGWKEGMAKPGVVERWKYKRTGQVSPRVVRARNALERERIRNLKPTSEEIAAWRARGASEADIYYATRQKSNALLKRQKKRELQTEKLMKLIEQDKINNPTRFEALRQRGVRVLSAAQDRLQMAHPNYLREQKKRYYQNRLKDPKLTATQRSKIMYQMAKAQAVRSATVRKFRERAAELVFPVESMTSYGSGSGNRTIQGVPGRGRPRGSLDKRYAAYGGVYGYRRYISAQKRALRARLAQQEQMMKQNRQPQYEQQQYQAQAEQLPQELQGQQITPQYQDVQYQQVPQEYAPQPQQTAQNEVKPVFKSSGGSPYPPVNRVPLASPKQTIPYGYVESVDSFTGRRFMKKLPQAEKWGRPR